MQRLLPPLSQAALVAAFLVSPSLSAQGGPPLVTDCHDFTAVDAELQSMVANTVRRGAAVSILRGGELLFERGYGPFTPTTQVPIASATKWLSGALIMVLVDDGVLDLDVPVSTYLPEFTGLKGTMTVRQMFSHTSGLPGEDPVIGDDTLTLAQAVSRIARDTPLRVPPGSDMFYGGVSMHVAGRVAEVVSGQDWNALFAARIAGPLGMTATDYAGLGNGNNPRIAGGARSTLRDYTRFMEMIVNRGVFRGRRILSAAAMDTMLDDQTQGAPVASIPPTAVPYLGYGIGCWVDRRVGNGPSLEVTSPGAFGFTGWVDRERGSGGVFAVQSLNRIVDPFADRVRELARAELRFAGLECYGRSAPGCAGPLRVRSATAPTSGNGSFALDCDAAPPGSAGVCLVSLSAAIPPTPVLGIDVHVALGPLTIGESVAADALGRASVPLPLSGVAAGERVFVQWVFLPTATCTGPAPLAASHAVALRVQG